MNYAKAQVLDSRFEVPATSAYNLDPGAAKGSV